MKKLLAIVVLGLLMSGNAYARFSILSEDVGDTGGWLEALIVCVPFFAYVFYSQYRNKKINEEETERQIRLANQPLPNHLRAKPKAKKKRKNI